jgi:hypothetical protein
MVTINNTDAYFKDLFNREGYRIPFRKAGIRMFNAVELPSEITHAEKGRMLDLTKLIIGQSNVLGYRQNGKIEVYTNEEIIEAAGLKERQGYDFLRKMLDLHVLQRVVTSSGPQYYVNPAYFFAGQRITLNLYLLFQDDLHDILPPWVIKAFNNQAKEKQVSQSHKVEPWDKVLLENEG